MRFTPGRSWQRFCQWLAKAFARSVGHLKERRGLLDAARRSLSTSIDTIQCEQCGGEAGLIRRSPDPSKSDGSEIWLFECTRCFHIMTQFNKR